MLHDSLDMEHMLSHEHYDFTAKYMAACRLNDAIRENPASVSPKTVHIIDRLYRSRGVSTQTQAYFLLKELSKALCAMGINGVGGDCSYAAFSVLFGLLKDMSGHAHRAAAEALGSLPFQIQGPDVGTAVLKQIPKTSLEDILRAAGANARGPARWLGRSLIIPLDPHEQVLVVKTAVLTTIRGGGTFPAFHDRERHDKDGACDEFSRANLCFTDVLGRLRLPDPAAL